MISEQQPDDEDSEAAARDLQRLKESDLLAIADDWSEDPHAKEAVLAELRRRRSPAYRDVLLALCVDQDVDPGVRLHLMRTGRQADRATSHAVWWLILHTGGGGFEYEEQHHQAVDLMSSADSDQSGEAEALVSIVGNDRLPGRLRALAGADLMEVLGPGGLPLLLAHLGDELVSMLDEAGDDDRARNLLWMLAERDGVDPDLRMEAATALGRDYRGNAENAFAGIATGDGIPWETRMTAVELAVEAADSAAAQAALDLLKTVLQTVAEPDDEALSRHLAEIRDSR